MSPLTEEQYLQVHLATKRESYTHRRWPADVVLAMARAAVIPASVTPPPYVPWSVARLLRAVRARLHPAHQRGRRAGTENITATA